jgi:hypothetical protein
LCLQLVLDTGGIMCYTRENGSLADVLEARGTLHGHFPAN